MPHSRKMAFWSSKNNPQVSAEALHALYGGLLQVPCFSVTLDESPNHLPQAPPASLRVALGPLSLLFRPGTLLLVLGEEGLLPSPHYFWPRHIEHSLFPP